MTAEITKNGNNKAVMITQFKVIGHSQYIFAYFRTGLSLSLTKLAVISIVYDDFPFVPSYFTARA